MIRSARVLLSSLPPLLFFASAQPIGARPDPRGRAAAHRFGSRAPLRFFLALLLLAPVLAACGKKNAPTPPPGSTNTYPRSYPRE